MPSTTRNMLWQLIRLLEATLRTLGHATTDDDSSSCKTCRLQEPARLLVRIPRCRRLSDHVFDIHSDGEKRRRPDETAPLQELVDECTTARVLGLYSVPALLQAISALEPKWLEPKWLHVHKQTTAEALSRFNPKPQAPSPKASPDCPSVSAETLKPGP